MEMGDSAARVCCISCERAMLTNVSLYLNIVISEGYQLFQPRCGTADCAAMADSGLLPVVLLLMLLLLG